MLVYIYSHPAPVATITYAPARNPIHIIAIDDKPLHTMPELIDDDDYDTGTWSKQFRNPLYDYYDAEMTAAADYDEPGIEVHAFTHSLKVIYCQTSFTPCSSSTIECRKN